MPDERPAEAKSFWATLPGLMTAFAGVCGAIATLVTALYSTGLIGKGKPEPPATPVHTAAPAPASPPAVRTEPDDRSRAELQETKRQLEEATRARQQAEEARAKADADAARLRQQQATAAAEAKRQNELEAARKKAEGAEAARVRADNAPTRDTVTSYRVVSVVGEEMDVEIAFSYDPRVHGDRGTLAGVHLLHEGTIISGYKPTIAPWQRGKAVVHLIVRTARGRQCDELEVFLYKSGERPFLTRRFPYVRTFD